MLAANVQTSIPVIQTKVNSEQEPQDSKNVNVPDEIPTAENISSTQDQNKSDKLTTEVFK